VTPVAAPAELLRYARLATGAGDDTDWGRSWERIAVFLVRTALEIAVTQHWTGPLTEMRSAPMSTQLICLPQYVDPDVAHRVHAAWAQLSTACHAHPYELPPTVDELLGWIEVVEALRSATSAWLP
jgi:hypothetical protein